jgi:hypothetical protein
MTDNEQSSGPITESHEAWLAVRADFMRRGLAAKWPQALALIGLFHLVACLLCHLFYTNGHLEALPYLVIWAAQLGLNILAIRKLIGRGWAKTNPIFGILARIWLTFLIISFSVTSYSEMSADQANAFNWFKPAWASLSCFAWAVTAWLVSPWFVLAAVWTWATGWLMIYRIHDAYLIYGIGWSVLLWIIAAILQQKSRRNFNN